MAKGNRTKNGHPTVRKALHQVANADIPEGFEAHRISVRLLASGMITYRIHPADGGEYIGGVESVE